MGLAGARTADVGPLPGGAYPQGTMSTVDIYPTHAGIGGIGTQDRTLPAFAEAMGARQARITNRNDVEGLLGTPAGYLAIAVVVLLALAWLHR